MPVFDFSNIKSMEALPDGLYNVTLSEYAFVPKSKSTGNPMVRLVFTVLDDEYKDRKLFKNYSLVPQALWAYKLGMVALGVDESVFDGEVDIDEIGAQVSGAECSVEVSTRPYNGRMTNNVDKLHPAGYSEDDAPF